MDKQKLVTRVITATASVIFIVTPLLLISQFSPYFYWLFERYGVYEAFTEEITNDELNAQFSQILEFIRPPFDTQLGEFFSAQDILHMQDVQRIFTVLFVIWGIALLIEVIYIWKGYQNPLKGLLRSMVLGVPPLIYFAGGYAGIFLFGLLNWDSFFTAFHRIVFPNNEFWLLDPASSNLIKFLPGEIFMELAAIYAILLFLEYLLVRRLDTMLWNKLTSQVSSQ